MLSLQEAKAFDNNYTGPEFSMFTARNSNSGRTIDGLFEKLAALDGNYLGWDFNIPLSRTCYFSAGVGLKKISYRKETQGVFPETGLYGLAVINGRNDYWTFPISVCWQGTSSSYGYRNSYNSRTINNRGLKISYIPSVLSSTKTNVNTTGGAVLSTYANDYPADDQVFQHSVMFSFCNQLFPSRSSFRLNVDPFISIGTSYFKSGGSSINTISYGINLSVHFKMPRITIEKKTTPDPSKADKKKQIEKKQKEIEEQLKKGKVGNGK